MPTDPPAFDAAGIAVGLLLAAVGTWSWACYARLLSRRLVGRPLLRPRRPAPPPPVAAAVVAGLLLFVYGINLFSGGDAGAQPPVVDARTVFGVACFNLFFAGLLELLRATGRPSDRRPSRPWPFDLRDAALVYGLVVPPTVVLLVALIPFRDPENANTLLRLLADEFDAGVFAAVVFSAVVAAPLAEEMIFRVILQPTLTRFFDMRWAVVVTAVLFASIHGPYDAVPLLPLSLALGWLYAVRGSVASVVLLHMIFNAVFLAFALLTT